MAVSDPVAAPAAQFFQQQLEKSPEDSKKFKLLMRGVYGILFIFVIACILLYLKPDIATPISSLAQGAVLALGGVVGIGCGSIAAVDFKNSGSLSQVVQATINK